MTGPTWEETPPPERTLGNAVIDWAETHLLQPDGPHAGDPWHFTEEQTRFVLNFYAITDAGRFVYRNATYRRMKGAGKNPFAVALACVEFVGPCRFGGWARDGSPLVVPHHASWVQAAGVSKDSTRNTMPLFPAMLSKDTIAEFDIDLGKELIYAHQARCRIEAVTSSPLALEGARATFIIRDEALALDTPLPTPTGWTRMGAVVVGDVLLGSDGGPVRVMKATEVQTERVCYRVTFADGQGVVASDGHRWLTKVAMSAAKSKVRTTGELLRDGRRFRVPVAPPWVLPAADLPVEPYLLGYWLGDGSTGQMYVAASVEDAPEVAANLRASGAVGRVVLPPNRAARIALAERRGFQGTTDLARAMRALPAYRHKRIPEVYLRGSIAQRTDLLRGLMDSDGHVDRGGRCTFVGRSDLAADVVALLRTLGQTPVTRWTTDSRSREGGYVRVTFTPRHGLVPFRLARKAARVRVRERAEWLTIHSIVPVVTVPVRCVEVDAPDHLFLAGAGAHVTHNTHHWLENNEGHAMAAVIDRNAAKSRDGAARVLSITNAHNPGEDSVGQRDYDAFVKIASGKSRSKGVLYDCREAPADVDLRDADQLRAGLIAARGDAVWLDVPRLMDEIWDPRTDPSVARRYYLNQIVAAEDAWVEPREWDLCADPDPEHAPMPGEEITLGFDGSMTDDHCALVGCRVSDSFLFTLGIWDPELYPSKEIPMAEVDLAVRGAMASYLVDGFFSDVHPFESYIDRWEADFGEDLEWVHATGRHTIAWDMRGRQKEATQAAEAIHDAIVQKALVHSGDRRASQYVYNARRRPNAYGVTFGKEHRESQRKVDWLAAAMLARLARQMYLTLPENRRRRKRSGRAIFV